jgi:hypothetical protein
VEDAVIPIVTTDAARVRFQRVQKRTARSLTHIRYAGNTTVWKYQSSFFDKVYQHFKYLAAKAIVEER